MKFFTSTLLCVATAAVFGKTTMAQEDGRALATLAEQWSITDPVFAYDGLDFTFDYAVSNVMTIGQAYYEIYDAGCQAGNTPVASGISEPGLEDVVELIEANEGLFSATGKNARVPFSIDANTIATSPIYSEVDNAGTITATIVYCVRFGLKTLGGTPTEVNFLESIVTMTVDLSNGFAIDTIAVTPKDTLLNTALTTYTVNGYMCNPGFDTEFVPGGPLSQGSLITVCIKPDLSGIADGIKMRTVDSFTWTRDANTQAAVEGGLAAGNLLTTFDADLCAAGDYCTFSSILFAAFYATTGSVAGNGIASMQFGTRRLADNTGGLRSLQEASAAGTSEFDLSVDIENTADDGPGTYGGTSAGASMSTMFGAVVGVVGAVALL
jgi:hypothetical protein